MLYAFEEHQIRVIQQSAPQAVSDGDLLAATAGGDETAFEALLARHRGLLHSVILRIVNNDAETGDVLQQCTIELWKHAGEYDPKKGVAAGWLVTMARRRAIDAVRRRQSYDSTRERYSAEPLSTIEPSVAESDASRHDTAEAVARAMARLPAHQADAVRLAFFAGFSQRQIAARTGIALGTIKTRLELGLQKLRTALRAYGDWKTEFAIS